MSQDGQLLPHGSNADMGNHADPLLLKVDQSKTGWEKIAAGCCICS